jgi:hypothetical protein
MYIHTYMYTNKQITMTILLLYYYCYITIIRKRAWSCLMRRRSWLTIALLCYVCVCMCVCVCVCVCARARVCVCIAYINTYHKHTQMCVHIYDICMYICMYV